MVRPASDRAILLHDAVADAWVLSHDYRDAALTVPERAHSNLLMHLAERYKRMAEDMQGAFAELCGEAPEMAPLPTCQHLFGWHLAEDDGDPSGALRQEIRETEDHLHGILATLLEREKLPSTLRAPVEHGHATTGDANLRLRVAQCLAPTAGWTPAPDARHGADIASPSRYPSRHPSRHQGARS